MRVLLFILSLLPSRAEAQNSTLERRCASAVAHSVSLFHDGLLAAHTREFSYALVLTRDPSFLESEAKYFLERVRAWSATNDSGVFVKYHPLSRRLLVMKEDKVVLFIVLSERFVSVARGTEFAWFRHFSENVRVGETYPEPQGFSPESRARHFEKHSGEFGIIPTEDGGLERYETRAKRFAESENSSTLSFRFFGRGSDLEKWARFDARTNELVVVNFARGNLLTYFRVDPRRQQRNGFSGAVDYFLATFNP